MSTSTAAADKCVAFGDAVLGGVASAKAAFDDLKARLRAHPVLTSEDLVLRGVGAEPRAMPKVAHLRVLAKNETWLPICEFAGPGDKITCLSSSLPTCADGIIATAAYAASTARGRDHVDVLMKLSMSFYMDGPDCRMCVVAISGIVTRPMSALFPQAGGEGVCAGVPDFLGHPLPLYTAVRTEERGIPGYVPVMGSTLGTLGGFLPTGQVSGPLPGPVPPPDAAIADGMAALDSIRAHLCTHPLLTAEDLAKATGDEYEKPLGTMPGVARLRALARGETMPPTSDLTPKRGWEYRIGDAAQVTKIANEIVIAAAYDASKLGDPRGCVEVLVRLGITHWMRGSAWVTGITYNTHVTSSLA
jgi:hypothetical protein